MPGKPLYPGKRTGFTSPHWNGYPTIMINPVTQPAAAWLLAHGQAYNANLATDANRDGVSLLMAYALNLDPQLNLSGSLPPATLQGDTFGHDLLRRHSRPDLPGGS